MSDMVQHPSVNSPKERPPKRSRSEWNLIGRRYIRSGLDGPAFCDSESLDYCQFRDHCARKRWNEERDQLLARIGDERDQEFVGRQKVVSAEIDQEAESAAKLFVASLCAAGEREKDLTKLKNGIAGVQLAYRLRRAANGLPKEKPSLEPDLNRDVHVPKTFSILNQDGKEEFYDMITKKEVPPTPDVIRLG